MGGRGQLVWVAVVAMASLLGAYALFFGFRGAHPWGTTNNGEFVQPPVSADVLGLSGDDGRPFESNGRWWLWTVAPQGCLADCHQALDVSERLVVLLHKDSSRVQRALVTGSDASLAATSVGALPVLRGDMALLRAGAYIVDPLGNLVLWYSYEQVGPGLLDDLKRLLEVSQIG